MEARRAFVSVGRLVVYAVVCLAVVGVFIGVQRMRVQNESVTADAPLAPSASEIAAYLAGQHRSGAGSPAAFEGKGAAGTASTQADQLSDCTAQWLGTRKTVDDLFGDDKSMTFIGARKSGVPGPGPSVQIMFAAATPGTAENSASLFLKKYMEAPKLEQGDCESLKGSGYEMVLWRSAGLVYEMVGPHDAVEKLRTALKAPAPTRAYDGK